ncbi:GNAT family N-acetyltransferase, partial [Calditerricola satsumensis]|uniref:GNAT family N-acetyltransferase n=1 Tax=Calditerricola satsumensis TaxID=373054 RepID=UPI002109F57F
RPRPHALAAGDRSGHGHLRAGRGPPARRLHPLSAHLALRVFEIGYWLRRTARGHGYAAETVQVLTRFAFEELKATASKSASTRATRKAAPSPSASALSMRARCAAAPLAPTGNPPTEWSMR